MRGRRGEGGGVGGGLVSKISPKRRGASDFSHRMGGVGKIRDCFKIGE